jgi:hypothetical protein
MRSVDETGLLTVKLMPNRTDGRVFMLFYEHVIEPVIAS